MATNYGELKTLVENFSHRHDTTTVNRIPDFIQLAEGSIARDVRAVEMVTTTTLDEDDRTADSTVYTLPSDFLAARQVTGTRSSAKYVLRHVSLAELHEYGTSGDPQLFSTYAGSIEFRGAPAQDTEFTLIYFSRPTALSNDNDTNDLLSNHPGLYLHAALAELHGYTQDIELARESAQAYRYNVDQANALAAQTRGAGEVKNGFNFDYGGTM